MSQVCVVIYRLTLHPLAKLPGPKFHAATHFPFLYQTYIEASAPRKVLAMHRKYGPIVRISPNQIAVDGSIGWPEVFAHASKNKQEFHKPHGNYAAGDTTSLIAAPKERHRHIRRALAHAFSDTSLNEHEVTLKLYMDLLMDRLGTMEKENKTFNIIHWLNFMSFDIIGDLSFSEPFGSLANNGYHPWIMSIFDGIRGNARRRFLRHYPTLRVIVNALGLNKEFDIGVANRKAASDMAQRRMDMGQEGPDGKKDYLSYMMRKNRDGETTVTDTEILSTSPILVVAGSETTATALTGLFFFLSQNPEKRDLLVEEIKDAYSSQEEVTMRNSARLEYLHATLDETLRLYPPVLANPARLSPGAELGGYYIPKDVCDVFSLPFEPTQPSSALLTFTRLGSLSTSTLRSATQRISTDPKNLSPSAGCPPRTLSTTAASLATTASPSSPLATARGTVSARTSRTPRCA